MKPGARLSFDPPRGIHLGIVLNIDLIVCNNLIEELEGLRFRHIQDTQETLAACFETFIVGGGQLLQWVELSDGPVVTVTFLQDQYLRRINTGGAGLCS